MKHYYFVGIGGSGMSPLAQVLGQRGHRVGGSDRNYDRKLNKLFFNKLEKQGICLFPQNGSGLPEDLDALVVSTAIEDGNRDVQYARSRGVPIIHRATLLAELFNADRGIGIGGTSGKSTVVGMVASVLDAAGDEPTVINGGIVKQYVSRELVGNARNGHAAYMVAEVDESDGSIVHFAPEIGVITNISKDHKEVSELRGLFQTFAGKVGGKLIINGDCAECRTLDASGALTFGLGPGNDFVARDTACSSRGSSFVVGENTFHIRLPGKHNVYNALAAIAVGSALSIPWKDIQKGLARFRGIKRRLDIIGSRKDVLVVDDFAHNPDKIRASAATLRLMGQRVIAVFQPHGYGPTRFMLTELAEAFSSGLKPDDMLVCLPIYDAGGTADRTISGKDLVERVQGPGARYVDGRKEAVRLVGEIVKPGDVVAVMGARDDTLTAFSRRLLKEI